MRRVLILDVETTGLDVSQHSIVELAAMLYDLKHGSAISSWASLVCAVSNAAEEVNRIPAALLAEIDAHHSIQRVERVVQSMAQHADAIVAWGAEFDRGFVQVAFGGPVLRQGQPIPWVCAMNHVAWPRPSSSRKLTQVVLAHDLGVSHAHRAAVDVDMVARVLTRARELGCNLEILLEDSLKESQRPRGRVVALVNYEDREKAKSAGFRWDKEKQEWWRVMPLDEAPALGFPVRLPPEQGNAA